MSGSNYKVFGTIGEVRLNFRLVQMYEVFRVLVPLEVRRNTLKNSP